MPRVKRGTIHLKKRRSLLKRSKGKQGGAKNLIRQAHESDLKAGHHAFVDRRKRKRDMRKLWNLKINAAVRTQGMTYSTFMAALKEKQIDLDRKVLAEIAENHPDVFKKVVETVK